MSFRKKKIGITLLSILFFSFVPGMWVLAAEKEVGKVPQKISLDGLSGLSLWLGSLYNDERIMYSIIVTLVMGVIGLSIGFVTDIILKILGLDVSKITHHE